MKKYNKANLIFAGVVGLNVLGIGKAEGLNIREKFNTEIAVSSSASPSPSGLKIDKLKQDIKAKIQDTRDMRAHFKDVKITSVGTGSITVEVEGKYVTVNITDKTQLRRNYWGKSELSEMSVGNKVDVIGKWTDNTKTAVNAVLIRNKSIQKRYGVFFGTIKSVNSNGFVLTTIHREDQTVTFDADSKLMNRRGESITKSDFVAGQRVRVRGLWDKTAKTITEVTEIKNFSLPPKSSGDPDKSPKPKKTFTPTPSMVPTLSPTPTSN